MRLSFCFCNNVLNTYLNINIKKILNLVKVKGDNDYED